jgi:hypothetical protein
MSRAVEVSDMDFNGDGAMGFLRQGCKSRNPIRRIPVANLKTLSAIAILTAAVATPVFAQPTHHHHTRALDRYRGAYNQVNGPSYATPQMGGRNFETSQFDRSFPGGENPDNNPPGN